MASLLTTSSGKTVRCTGGVVVLQSSPESSVLVGEHYYPYTQIGNLLWTTRNLYEPLGTFGNEQYTESCWVDWEVNSPKGMLYQIGSFAYDSSSGPRAELKAMLLGTGWRIPTVADVDDLFTAANMDWEPLTLPEFDGTDTLGFHAQLMTPMATDHTSPEQYPLGQNKVCKFIMIPGASGGGTKNIFQIYHPTAGECMSKFKDNNAWRVCIRLCKDA